MHAGGRCRHTLTSQPRETVVHISFLEEMDKEDPTQGLPERLQPFTDNLEDLAEHVPAHFSEREDSDAEAEASKVVTQKRKHSIYIHFTQDRNCDVSLRTKITRVPCRRRNEDLFHEQKSLVT